MKFLSKNSGKFGVFLLITAVSAVLMPINNASADAGQTGFHPVKAVTGYIFGKAVDAVEGLLEGIGVLFGYIMASFVSAAAYILNLTLVLNMEIGKNNIITNGWEITRNLANMGFVLVIVIIAIATILRFGQYGARQLLVKLIASAILVNFSIALVSPLIAFSNALTGAFLDRIGGTKNTATNILNKFDPQKFYQVRDEKVSAFETVAAKAAQPIVRFTSVIFIIIFSFILFMTLMALAIMMLIRYVALIILLILAPLAWLFWILPATSSLANKWWSQFLRWVFFAPAVAFFIYLAMSMGDGVVASSVTKASGAFTESSLGVVIKDIFAQFANMVVLTGLLLGGLITANAVGIHGAKAALAVTQAGAKGIGLGITKRTGRAVGWAGRKIGGQSRMQAWASSRYKFLRAIGRPMSAMYRGTGKLGGLAEKYTGEGTFYDETVGAMKKASGLFKAKKKVAEWYNEQTGEVRKVAKKPEAGWYQPTTQKFVTGARPGSDWERSDWKTEEQAKA